MTTILNPTMPNGAKSTPLNWPKQTPEQIALVQRLKTEQGVKSATWEELLGDGRDLWTSEEDFESFLEAMGRPIGGRK